MNFNLLRSKSLLWVLIICLLILPKILSSTSEVLDPFNYSSIAVSQASADQDRILFHPFDPIGGTFQLHADFISERTAVTSFYLIITKVMGLTFNNLLFLPINGIILVLLSYCLALLFSNSRIIALFFAFFLAYDPAINALSYNFFYIGLAFSLFFTFLIVFMKSLKSRNFSIVGLPLLILIFSTILLTYYTTEVNTIVFTVASTALILGISRINSAFHKINTHLLIGLSLAFVILFITFDSIFSSYLPKISGQDSLGFISNYIDHVQNLFSNTKGAVVVNQSTVFTSNIGLLLYVSICAPIILYILYLSITFLRKGLKKEKIRINNVTYLFFFALLAPWIGDIVIYTSQGIFPFKYMLLIFPLLAFFSISRIPFFKQRRSQLLRILLMAIIVGLCVGKFGAWYYDERLGYADSYDTQISPTSSFLSEYANRGNVLADLTISGRLMVDLTKEQKVNDVSVYPFANETSKFIYAQNSSLTDSILSKYKINYLVLSHENINQTMTVANWLVMSPLGNTYYYLENVPTLNRLYDDNQGVIYYHT